MKDLKIGILDNNGNLKDYLIDSVIIEGLYPTFNVEKIKSNCEVFEIEIGLPEENQTSTKISKREEMGILTIIYDQENQVQYLVGGDMKPEEFKNLSEKEMPASFKELILETFKMTQRRTLADFLKDKD